MARKERRKKKRIQLTRGILARFGTVSAIILDITDAGVRIEHFNRLDLHRTASFRFEWQKKPIEVVAEVRSCRVHRFAAGDDGSTVYQSGLFFATYVDDAETALRNMVSTIVARSLAEQVANARGIGPVIERDMPVFRDGAVAGASADRGYVCCRLVGGNRFEKKWSRTPDAPVDGFTVSATEPAELVDQLCENYLRGDMRQRELIRILARVSVDG